MRVTFLGTGTSTGVPVIGCDCAVCRSTDARDRRWRSSVYLTLADDTRLLIDASTDLRAQALAFGVRRVDAILFTHSHADHILGIDDVRPFSARGRGPVPCYGDAATLEAIRRMFAYVFDPNAPVGGGLPQLDLRLVNGPFDVGAARVVPVPIWHGKRQILGFRLGRFAYLTDCNGIPDESYPLLGELDVLVLSALRDRPHPTHFSVAESLAAVERIRPERAYFIHMTHDLPHAATCARLPAHVALAHDGLVVDVAGP
jgi:phosphoribosyl 1,2-cyclic phosphate phosphodiesterase